MSNIKKLEEILNGVVAERCTDITEKLFNTNKDLKEKFNKLGYININENEFWDLQADIQNIMQKQIYIYAFSDGMEFNQRMVMLQPSKTAVSEV